jgi:NAD(P)-dependent dehydrogenase (short-subunit alcohol dehydrogenase family)
MTATGLGLAALAAGGLGLAAAKVRKWRSFSLRDRTVLITGGSRGLGLVMAREFAREGARIAICARDPGELERAAEDLLERGATVLTVRCDVSDRADVERMVGQVRERLGQIDVLVNNAGLVEVGPMEVMELDDYRDTMAVHFWGPLYATLAVLPEMRARGEGRIVNIASVGGRVSVPHLLPYSASKFALVGLSEGLRAALLKHGVLVTTVCPGLMRTGSPVNAVFKGKHRAEHAWFAISDSLPAVSIGAERAARQIVDACRRGRADLVISAQAKIATVLHGLAPGVTANVLGLVNMLLPNPGGIGARGALGRESASVAAPSILTTLTDQAARRNNEAP